MASLITGEVEAVSWKNRSFKLQDGDWFKLGNDLQVDIKDIKKGMSVTLDYNPYTKDGRTTNYVNLLDIESEGGNGHEEPAPAPKAQPKGDPRDETPPIGAHGSRDEYDRKDRKITLLALHKAICPAMLNAGLENPEDIWAAVAQHERELNKLLGK